MLKSLNERFLDKIELIPFHPCWEWQGNKKKNGYGRIWVNQKSFVAHRVSYELHMGPIPLGLSICHSCDNPSCVNPSHLFIGTHTDNMRDMHRKHRGNKPKGVKHFKSKLTEHDIKEIRCSNQSSRSLAAQYSVSHHNILCIINRKTWKHVD